MDPAAARAVVESLVVLPPQEQTKALDQAAQQARADGHHAAADVLERRTASVMLAHRDAGWSARQLTQASIALRRQTETMHRESLDHSGEQRERMNEAIAAIDQRADRLDRLGRAAAEADAIKLRNQRVAERVAAMSPEPDPVYVLEPSQVDPLEQARHHLALAREAVAARERRQAEQMDARRREAVRSVDRNPDRGR